MSTSTAITIYEDMAVERAVDAVMLDVGRTYRRKLEDLLDTIFALVRERDPHSETCPMCGGGLMKAKDGALSGEGRPQGRAGWMSTSLAVGMGAGAIAGALAAVGLQHLFKVRQRSRSDRLVALLRAQPGRPISELATELYGTDTSSNRGKIRALLAQLGRLGRLRNIGPGCWEAVGEEEQDEGEEVRG